MTDHPKGWIEVTGFDTGWKISVQVGLIAAIADPDPEGHNCPMLQLAFGGSISVRETRSKLLVLIADDARRE